MFRICSATRRPLTRIVAVLIALLISLFSIHCKRDSNSRKDIYLYYLLRNTWPISLGDYYARLYRVWPDDINLTTFSIREVTPYSSSLLITPGRKKLILVHGWYYSDRNTGIYPSASDLQKRISDPGNWGDLFPTTEFHNIIQIKGYDVYAFDYLTADPVDLNGQRFRTILDSYFSGSTDTLVIFAHSMGGLVTRFTVYGGTNPPYITKVITAGTPYHGSPWASPQFQQQIGFGSLTGPIGDLVAYLTNTEGGHNLAWDNWDGMITGASNPLLDSINAKSDRDGIFKAYYGSCDHTSGTPCSDALAPLVPACAIWSTMPSLGPLSSGTPADFTPSDCIVPAKSAILQSNTASPYDTASSRFGTSIYNTGAYDHTEIKLGIPSIRTQLLSDLP